MNGCKFEIGLNIFSDKKTFLPKKVSVTKFIYVSEYQSFLLLVTPKLDFCDSGKSCVSNSYGKIDASFSM